MLKPFLTHTDWAFKKIMHFFLRLKIPGVSFIPHTTNQFTGIQETGFFQFRGGLVLRQTII